MPTKSTRSSKRNYKIRISAERTLGPLDLDRVTALVMKGRVQGHESTSVEPYTTWAPFTAFPELGELLLKKMETDTHRARQRGGEEQTSAMPATKTIVSQEATKTMVQGGDGAPPEKKEDSELWEMPTLLDIKAPENKKEDNPDLEKTQVFLPALMDSRELEDGATKILTTENIEQALVAYSPPESKPVLLTGDKGENNLPVKRGFFGLGKPVDPDEYIDEKSGKKRLMTRNTAALVALGILMMAYWQYQDEEAANPENLFPRRHTFPYIEVNVPPRLGVDADPAKSAELTEEGNELTSRETPSSYIRAIRVFYKAVGRNPKNQDAKALLASCYMRLSETVPRNKRLFETVEKLILPGPPPGQWTPDYVVARAEYYQMLNRHDQAQEIIDAYLKVRPTPEVLYQKAKIAYERRELDTALNIIAKAIPPEKMQRANPRHLFLYSMLLEKKGQKDAALANLNRLKRESISYGPGVLYYADFHLRNGKPQEAFKALRFLINNPALLEGMQRAEAFAVTAKTFETMNMMEQSYRFARAAFRDHYNREEVEDLLFRVKSKLPKFKEAYALIVNARQREKAKENEKAINLYVQALERNRNDAIPFMMLARLYEEKGDVYEAIDRYLKALTQTPEKPIEAAVNLARIYISRFDLDKAKEMIKRSEQMSLGASRARLDQVLYLKALLHLKTRKLDLAEPFFDKALDRGSRFVDLYLQMGDLETERKQERLAEFYYSVALRYEPFHPKAMLGVALTRFHSDSPSRAISFLKDKLNTQPNSAAIMTNLAIIYLRSGDQLSGKNYLQNAIRSDSRYAEAFRLLGDLTKDEGNRQSDYSAKRHSYRYALASYEMYSKLAPNDPEGFKATADLYFDIRDLGAAAKNYHKVLDLTPNYPEVRLRLAQISRNGGDGERAMGLLEEEIKINAKSDAAWVEKGNIFMAKKDFLNATKSFTEAARINEKNSDALFGLGVVYHLQGSYDNALSLFGRVIKLDPLKADVYWQMGLIYQKQNNKTKAMQAFTNYKGIVREPAAISKADDKMRELSAK